MISIFIYQHAKVVLLAANNIAKKVEHLTLLCNDYDV
jgi:hypothetical protein